MKEQNNKCKLCSRNPETVDHCHKTGRIRGLLCGKCNIQLSQLDRDLKWLKRAFDYVGVIYATFSLNSTNALSLC